MPPSPDPSTLQAFLDHPSRPAGALSYHELQGFLFTVVSAPELVRPSEWLPIIFAGEEAGFTSPDGGPGDPRPDHGAVQHDQRGRARPADAAPRGLPAA